MIVIVTGFLRSAVNDCISLLAAGTFFSQIIYYFLPLYPTLVEFFVCGMGGRFGQLKE